MPGLDNPFNMSTTCSPPCWVPHWIYYIHCTSNGLYNDWQTHGSPLRASINCFSCKSVSLTILNSSFFSRLVSPWSALSIDLCICSFRVASKCAVHCFARAWIFALILLSESLFRCSSIKCFSNASGLHPPPYALSTDLSTRIRSFLMQVDTETPLVSSVFDSNSHV